MNIVFTNGCFDLLHEGHINLLREAAVQGDYFIVAVNDDDSVRHLKGAGRPFQTLEERIDAIIDTGEADAVIPFDGDPLPLIYSLRPKVMVKGDDWTMSSVTGASALVHWGGRLHLVKRTPGISTTEVARAQGRIS